MLITPGRISLTVLIGIVIAFRLIGETLIGGLIVGGLQAVVLYLALFIGRTMMSFWRNPPRMRW